MALSSIRDDRKLSKHAKLVSFVLVSHADVKGTCFPGLKTLAAECKMACSSVSEALDEIEAFGDLAPVVIRRLHMPRKDGARGRGSNLYLMSMPLVPPTGIKSPSIDAPKPDDLNPPTGINEAGDAKPAPSAIESEIPPHLIPPGGVEARQGSTTTPDANLEPGPKGPAHRPVHSPESIHILAGLALAAANANGQR